MVSKGTASSICRYLCPRKTSDNWARFFTIGLLQGSPCLLRNPWKFHWEFLVPVISSGGITCPRNTLGTLGNLRLKSKNWFGVQKLKLKNLLELPIEDFEAVANLFGVFYRVEFGSHGSTELGPSVYIAGVRLKGSRDFSLEAEFSRPFRTKRGGVFLPAALLLLRTLHHALKQRPKLVLCIRSVPTTVNYPSFCEIKAWTIWNDEEAYANMLCSAGCLNQ